MIVRAAKQQWVRNLSADRAADERLKAAEKARKCHGARVSGALLRMTNDWAFCHSESHAEVIYKDVSRHGHDAVTFVNIYILNRS